MERDSFCSAPLRAGDESRGQIRMPALNFFGRAWLVATDDLELESISDGRFFGESGFLCVLISKGLSRD